MSLPLTTVAQSQANAARAANPSELEQVISGVTPTTVELGGDPLFEVKTSLGTLSASDRAKLINQRLKRIAEKIRDPVPAFKVEADQPNLLIVADTQPPIAIATITPKDGEVAQQSQEKLAASYIQKIRTALETYRAERSPQKILKAILYTILASLGLIMAFRLGDRGYALTLNRLHQWIGSPESLRGLRGTRFLSLSPFLELFLRFFDLGRNILNLVLMGFYFFLILSFFPWTEPLSENFWALIRTIFNQIIRAIIAYLPNLILLVLIIFITREILAFTRLFFREIERGNITVSWLYPDWIEMTFRLVSFFVIALAFAIALPFLPGFQSPAFQGVSLLISALVTFGAASTVANIVGGVVAVYTRSFQLSDMVKIGDLVGIVVSKDLLVTRIRTPKNEVITIPNATVVTSNIINYSSLAKDKRDATGLILHTTITLGYDIPWPAVHKALIAAAAATPDILPSPSPFVLQTALNDFNVSYELNAYTDCSENMPAIYSALHQNIQDQCNQAGIEILSPGYLAMRDGNRSTIPADYLPEDYQAPGFRFNATGDSDYLPP
ncbi:MAG: mechanosensitive ion channel family protein [Cyanobacteria bacterium REEB459]|nr:mechanosensitive ion channel family protein [Cyanobacteria bacterium REEB459]